METIEINGHKYEAHARDCRDGNTRCTPVGENYLVWIDEEKGELIDNEERFLK